MANVSQAVTLLTDFGLSDGYVAQMKGAILGIAPDARIVDVTHEVPPQDVLRAAWLISDAYPSFPEGTVHAVVVDPGVGSERRVICVSAAGQLFLAPDNGVLELVLRRAANPVIFEVSEARYFRAEVSRTFHGRDIFAPVAAHLANGLDPAKLGPTLSGPVRLDIPVATFAGGRINGSVAFADRFGNLITDIDAGLLGELSGEPVVRVAGREIRGISRTYSDAPPGGLVCYVGSSDRLEIAVTGGSAVKELGSSTGEPVEVATR